MTEQTILNSGFSPLVTLFEESAGDAVNKFTGQPIGNRNKELWGLYVAYSTAARQLKVAIDRERTPLAVDEGQRQIILLALAELSLPRPGWYNVLQEIALKMDNQNPDGTAQMFEEFRQNTIRRAAEVLSR